MNTPTKEKALTTATDRLAKLPPELREKVLMLLPDLPALQSLIYASDVCKATFEQNPVKIVNSIMSGLTLKLRQVMRVVAKALTGSTGDALIDDGLSPNLRVSSKDESELMDELKFMDEMFGPPTLPPALPLPSIHKFLLLACLIHQKGSDCLETHFHRLWDIETEYLLGEDYDYAFAVNQQPRDYPPEIGLPPQKTEPAGSFEQYRFKLTLWHLQLLVNFGQNNDGVHCPDLSVFEQGLITSQDFARMWKVLMPWERDHMQSVHDFVEKGPMTLDPSDSDKEEGEFWFPKAELASTSSSVTTDQPPLDDPPTDELARARDQDRFAANRPTMSRRFIPQSHLFASPSVKRGIDWKVFRSGFWDLRKTCERELSPGNAPPCDPPECVGHPAGDGHVPGKGAGFRIDTKDNRFFTWMRNRLDGKDIVSEVSSQGTAPDAPQS